MNGNLIDAAQAKLMAESFVSTRRASQLESAATIIARAAAQGERSVTLGECDTEWITAQLEQSGYTVTLQRGSQMDGTSLRVEW